MNKLVPIGLGAAAVVVALVVGTQVLGSPEAGGVGGAPTAEPTPAASPTPVTGSGTTGLQPGTSFSLTDEGSLDGMPTQPVTVTIPAAGWDGDPRSGVLVKGEPNPPDGAGTILFFGDLYVYGDPCRWSSTRPETPATTVDEIVSALAAQALREASTPVDVTLDGYTGKAVTLHVPGDALFSECDGSQFGSWGLAGADQAPMRYHQGPGQIDEVWVVDVNGVPAIIDWTYYEDTPQSVVDELRAIVESIRFE